MLDKWGVNVYIDLVVIETHSQLMILIMDGYDK